MRFVRGEERAEGDGTAASRCKGVRRLPTGSELVQAVPRGRGTEPVGRGLGRHANRRLDKRQRFGGGRYVRDEANKGVRRIVFERGEHAKISKISPVV